MQRAICFSILICSAVLLQSNAIAGWQYTKWGMTPEEVVSASKGEATLNENSGKNISPWVAKLKAQYKAGDFAFDAIFNFDPTIGLAAVTLEAAKGECRELERALTGQYGDPFHSGGSFAKTVKWRDTKNDNLVQFVLMKSSCEVSYFRLSTPGL